MSSTNIADFGPLVITTDVDEAVVGTLRLWLPRYLSHFERERSIPVGSLPRPSSGSFHTVTDSDQLLDQWLPAILVTTARGEAQIEAWGDGYISAGFQVTISAIVRGRDDEEARKNAARYEGCIRRIMVHQPDLGGFAGGVQPMSVGLVQPVEDELDQNRYLAVGQSSYLVMVDKTVQGAVGPFGGPGPYDPPDEDPDTPFDPLAEVSGTTFDVIPKED